MTNLAVNLLYDYISEALLDKEFLHEFSISHRLLKKHLKDPAFTKQIGQMIADNNYSCQALWILCEKMILDVAKEHAPEDWLEYFYQFALSKSFPEAVEIELLDSLQVPSMIYLTVLRVVSEFQKSSKDGTWQSQYPLKLLTSEEESQLEDAGEYKAFKKAFYKDYLYEMMKLNQEVKGFSTLDHICGVHFLALHVGRQLKEMGLPVDLGRVSGAAAGHDVGKYGCKGEELKRVPYLHYYYTGEWFKKHEIVYIRNIAMNHSTWDLELENLSLEALILIYCDFRVKSKGPKMHIYPLQESFDVILQKLDNVDSAKEQRYQRVYAKLKDFEDYMVSLGISLDLEQQSLLKARKLEKNYSLMQGEEIIESLKHLAIRHNIKLMHRLRNEFSLNHILESARSEAELHDLRGYLDALEEYSTYLTQKQKLITIQFLYELLIHPENDIRKHCGALIGTLIAMFDEEYRKEMPQSVQNKKPELSSSQLFEKYLQLMIYSDPKIISLHRAWIGYSLSSVVDALFAQCPVNQQREFVNILLKYYEKDCYLDMDSRLYLLEAMKYIPLCDYTEEETAIFFTYIADHLKEDNEISRLSALETLYHFLVESKGSCGFVNGLIKRFSDGSSFLDTDLPAENYLKMKISAYIPFPAKVRDQYQQAFEEDTKEISNIFLSNLKTATSRTAKRIQVDLVLDYTFSHPNMGFQTAMHYCNLLKVSASEGVRKRAGENLIKIAPYFSVEQRNDIVVELLRALEIEGYQFTKYIPKYLGQMLLYLKPVELDEVIDDLIEKVKQSNSQLSSLLLQTIGVAIEHYPKYRSLFKEETKVHNHRLTRMLGILLNGLVSYYHQTKQVSFRVLGKRVFGSKHLSLEQKHYIFKLIAKKILTLLLDSLDEKDLAFLNNAAALNHMYRFISDCSFYKGSIDLPVHKRIAFFPGTFDPFTLSHKEIAKEIQSLGFEVYLAIDEFSWSKHTQPNLIRRAIVQMSIADEPNIYLYPEDFPVNIANPEDLEKLRYNFPRADVHIAVGSDVVLNASAYKIEQQTHSIHSFSHIIFDRRSSTSEDNEEKRLSVAMKNIHSNVVRLSLSPQYEDISSTQIRNYIDVNRDISKLIDPMAQKFIYERGLYKREPQYKSLIQTKSIAVEIVDMEDFTPQLFQELTGKFCGNPEEAYAQLLSFSQKLSPKLLLLKSNSDQGRILGFSAFHWIRLNSLYKEFHNDRISDYVRKNSIGRILVIDGLFTEKNSILQNLEHILLTETLAFGLAKDYTYGIFRNTIGDVSPSSLYDILRLQGFISIPGDYEGPPIFTVDMTSPCTLNLDIASILKEPLRSNPEVIACILRARRRLQGAITRLYPGNLVLSLDQDMMYETLIKKICDTNGVSTIPVTPRALGSMMCVPCGMILNGWTIPNTVTKSLHTDRLFDSDMRTYDTGTYPYYLSLENQIHTIRSFDKPVLLVDDLLVQGNRMKVLDPILKNAGIDVKKIFVGILSDRGKELMDIQNWEVDSAYYIPKLRVWFNESLLYPFIGGDTLWRGAYPDRNILPSVNFVLPYTYPGFIKGASKLSIYQLSEICLENAMDILTTIEREYQRIHQRQFTLAQLGEVFFSPRYPDRGRDMHYEIHLSPSHYLKNDQQHLQRLKKMFLT